MKKHSWFLIIAMFFALYLALGSFTRGGWQAVGESFLCLALLFGMGVWYGIGRRTHFAAGSSRFIQEDIDTMHTASSGVRR